MKNIIDHPTEEKYRKLKASNDAFYNKVGKYSYGSKILKECGFDKELEFMIIKPENINMNKIEEAY